MRTPLGYMGPAKTPNIIRELITLTAIATLFSSLIDPFLIKHFGFSLQYFLSLSSAVFRSFYVWQPLSYLFVLQTFGGISFGLVINLFFQMYILWMMGSQIAERYGNQSFIKLYFGSGILAGALTLPYYLAYPIAYPLSGPTASLFAIFVVWTILHQRAQIFLFLLIPIQAKWLLAAGFGISFIVFVSEGSFLPLILLVVGTFSGYFYATFFKELFSPFPIFQKIDSFFIQAGRNIRERKTKKPRKKKKSKIVNFPSGKPVETDEEFVDRMLDKISKKGESSLTKEEKKRLDKIAKKDSPFGK